MYTKPELFFDGINPASDRAIEHPPIVAYSSISPRTRIHDVPTEIQDQILSHTSLAPVKVAQLDCALDLGTPFMWSSGGRHMEVVTRRTHWLELSLVEQHIWFEDHFSGLVHK